MYSTRVFASLALLVRVAHCFSWDIVVGEEKRLDFFNNGLLEYVEDIPEANEITSVTYDAVNNRVLFADYHNTNTSISSFDLATSKTQPVLTIATDDHIRSLTYDPVTQVLFWIEGIFKIRSSSLKLSNKAVYGKAIVYTTFDFPCNDIAVDSCGGFIYWITNNEIERAAFDGSKREVLVNGYVPWRRSLAIDQQKHKMYWIEETSDNDYSIKSADLNGKNIRTFYSIGRQYWAHSLALSKNFIYWWSHDQKAFLQLKKRQQRGEAPIVYTNSSTTYSNYQALAAKYTIKEQTLGIQGCEALKNTTKVSAECDGTVCHNYCFHGNCIVSAEGQPKCSCEVGFSGKRCEVDVCYKHCLNDGVCSLNENSEPVCQCTGDYEGDRCDVPAFITKLFLYAYNNIPPATLCERVKTCAATVV